MYARGDGDETCPRVRRGPGATVAAPAWSRAHQACRRRKGSRWACMVGWPGLRAALPPLYPGPLQPPRPALPSWGKLSDHIHASHPGGCTPGEPLLGAAQ